MFIHNFSCLCLYIVGLANKLNFVIKVYKPTLFCDIEWAKNKHERNFLLHRISFTGNAPEVYLLHLHVAVYMFFHRLYAMYPNNFLVYLKAQYGESLNQGLYQNTIKVRGF